jgi:hypothetical protein
MSKMTTYSGGSSQETHEHRKLPTGSRKEPDITYTELSYHQDIFI